MAVDAALMTELAVCCAAAPMEKTIAKSEAAVIGLNRIGIPPNCESVVSNVWNLVANIIQVYGELSFAGGRRADRNIFFITASCGFDIPHSVAGEYKMRTPKRAIAYLFNIIPIASMLIVPAMTFAQDENTSSSRRSWGYVFAGAQKGEKYTFVPADPYGIVKVDSTYQFSRAGGGWEWLTYKGMAI